MCLRKDLFTEKFNITSTYKKGQNIRTSLQSMENIFDQNDLAYEIIFCLDPSSDNTKKEIKKNLSRMLLRNKKAFHLYCI